MIASHEAAWRSARHRDQWRTSLKNYAFPVLGSIAVADITTEQVLAALEPIWTEKSETASRVTVQIESVLDWAKARGLRDGENPARWRGTWTIPAASGEGSPGQTSRCNVL